MHSLLIVGLVIAGTALYGLVMVFVVRFAGFNRLPSG